MLGVMGPVWGFPTPALLTLGGTISVVGCCFVYRGTCDTIPGLCPLETRSTSPLRHQKMSLDVAKFFPLWGKPCPVENHWTHHSIGLGTVNILFVALTLAQAGALRMCKHSPVFLQALTTNRPPTKPKAKPLATE